MRTRAVGEKIQLYNNKLYVIFLFVYRRLSLKPVDEQERSLSVLTGYLETVMTSILSSTKVCPSYMRAAFRNLARRVSDHFGDEPEYEVGRKIFVMMFDEKEQEDQAMRL